MAVDKLNQATSYMNTLPIQLTPFGGLMAELHKGKFLPEVNEELRKVTRACAEFGGKGSLTITIKVDAATGKSSTASITGDVKTKVPKQELRPTVRFLTPAGDIVNEDPEQPELPMGDKVTPLTSVEEPEEQRRRAK